MTATILPWSAYRKAFRACKAAAEGSRRAAFLGSLQADIGTAWHLWLIQDGSERVKIRMSGLVPISGGKFVIPTSGETLILQTANLSVGSWKLRIGTESVFLEDTLTPSTGAGPFKSGENPAAGGTISLGVITWNPGTAIETYSWSGGATPPARVESADGTYITNAGEEIVLADLSYFSISSARKMLRNGAASTTPDNTQNVRGILKYGGSAYQTNTAGGWWKWIEQTSATDPNNWVFQPSGDPRNTSTGQIPRPAAPSGATISEWVLESPRIVSPRILGIHCYSYPFGASYIGYNSSKPTFPYKVRRSFNYNEAEGTAYRVLCPSDGTYYLNGLNALLDRCQADGAGLLLTWWYIPLWQVSATVLANANNYPSPMPGWAGSTSMPVSLAKMKRDLVYILNHCNTRNPGVVIGVETKNEPDVNGSDYWAAGLGVRPYWLGSQYGNGGGKEETRLQELAQWDYTVWDACKSATTPVPCIAGAFSPGDHSTSPFVSYYNRQVNGRRLGDLFDGFACHPYTTGTGAAHLLDRHRQYFNDRNATMPNASLWSTECGDETSGGQSNANHAITIKRRSLVSAMLGFETVCNYSYEDQQYLGNPWQNADPRAALQWVADNLPGKTMDWGARLSDGSLMAWFRDGTTARA